MHVKSYNLLTHIYHLHSIHLDVRPQGAYRALAEHHGDYVERYPCLLPESPSPRPLCQES